MIVLEGGNEISEGLTLQKNTAADLITEEYSLCLSIWNKWNAHGILPYSGGYWEQPAHVCDVIDIFDTVYAKWSE